MWSSIFIYDLSSGEIASAGSAVGIDAPFLLREDLLLFSVSEEGEGRDLNADGRAFGHVLHVRDLRTGRTMNLGLAGDGVWGEWLLLRLYESQQGTDLDGDGAVSGRAVFHLVDLRGLDDLRPHFVRGEASADGRLDVGDAIFTLSWLFLGGREPSCLDAVDVDDDGGIDISDAVRLLRILFLPGEPPPPGLACGPDETDDALDCRSFVPCLGGA